MVDRTNKLYLTAAEMLVMRSIWLADHDLVLSEVVRECNETYGKDWKPQTVSTYLSHLVQKQFLRMDRNGKIYSYHPLVSAEDFMAYDLNNFIDYWAFTPARLLQKYLELRGCSEEEKQELQELLNQI